MKSAYDILGVPNNATEDQIKSAYRELAKKYHPDNYADSPLSDLASEKMSEVNAAYDEVMNNRRATSGKSSNSGANSSSKYPEVRELIAARQFTRAEEVLDMVQLNERGGEWYFLKGTVYYSRGWLEDALNFFTTACNLEPQNVEYRAALERLSWQRKGNIGGNSYNGSYRTPHNTNCSACDLCQGLICADCCCECLGGDIISCC